MPQSAATLADDLESLRALRARIAALQVTRCRMSHERVRMENGAALRVSRGEPEPSLVRMGLCTPEARARNLACGHTMARYLLLDAVRALQAPDRPDAALASLHDALESVANAIHLLDHQKGEAERQLALAREAGTEGAPTAEVRRLEEQHDAFAGHLRELQRAVLAHLDTAIHAHKRASEPSPVLAC